MAKKKMTEELGTTLAFRRALEITDASMYTESDEGVNTPIVSFRHGMRTTKGYDTTKESGAALKDNGDDSSNLSYVEMAKLNADDSILNIKFGITILPIYTHPEMADSNEKYNLIVQKNNLLLEDEAVDTVSRFYAYKIINGSWGWRNRDVASSISVSVTSKNEDFQNIKMHDVETMPLHPVLTSIQKEFDEIDPLVQFENELKPLTKLIKKALLGEIKPLVLEIKGKFVMQNGATVYPSQLFSPVEVKVGKSPLGKRLFTMPFNSKDVKNVGITAEKINNALRKFDLVCDEDGNERVLSIDPNGSDTITKKAYRGANKRLIDLYKRLLFGEFETLSENDKIFLVGSLVRGGLFQEASKKSK